MQMTPITGIYSSSILSFLCLLGFIPVNMQKPSITQEGPSSQEVVSNPKTSVAKGIKQTN